MARMTISTPKIPSSSARRSERRLYAEEMERTRWPLGQFCPDGKSDPMARLIRPNDQAEFKGSYQRAADCDEQGGAMPRWPAKRANSRKKFPPIRREL